MRQVLVSFGLLFGLALAAQAMPVKYRAQVNAIAEDQTWVIVTQTAAKTSPTEWKSFTLTVTDQDDQAVVKQLHPGDLVSITADGQALQEIDVQIFSGVNQILDRIFLNIRRKEHPDISVGQFQNDPVIILILARSS